MLDVERFLQGVGIQYWYSIGGKGPQVRMDCPVCRGQQKLWIGVLNERTICFRCQWVPKNSTDLVRTLTGCNAFQAELLLRKYRRVDEGEENDGRSFAERVAGRLAEFQAGYGRFPGQEGPIRYDEQDAPDLVLPNNFFPLGHRFVPTVTKYAISRGYSMERMLSLGFGGCVLGKYSGCLIIPTYNNGKLVFWQARDTLNRPDVPKYRSPVGHSATNGLFNLDQAVKHPEVIICEGAFSSMRVGEDAVATFGNKISIKQINLLKEHGVKRVVLCFDPDTWHLPEAVVERGGGGTPPIIPAVQTLIAHFERVRVVRLINFDPDDLGTVSVRGLIEDAAVVNNDTDLLRLRTGLRS